MSDNNGGRGIIGVVGAAAIGALIGAGVALLMAPKPGSELREDLKSSAQAAIEKLQQVAEQVGDQVKAATAQIAEAQDAEAESEEPQAEPEAE